MTTGKLMAGLGFLHGTFVRVLLLLLVVKGVVPSLRAETPQMNWQHVYPYPSGSWLNAVAWGSPGFVAVGSNREMLFSTNGVQWMEIGTNAPAGIGTSDVCFYNGRYVVIGDAGAVAWSTNGQDWHLASVGTNASLRTCAGGGGQYVIAYDNSLLVSSNAEDWQARPAPANFVNLTYGSNLWTAVDRSATIYTSTDLQNWTAKNLYPFGGGPVLETVCYGAGKFIAGGAWGFDGQSYFASVIDYSSNGVDWISASLDGLDAFGELKDSAFAAGQFVTVRDSFFLRSTNGENWDKITPPDSGGALSGITGSPSGRFVAVGIKGAMLRSDDAQRWTVISTDPRDYIQDLAYASGRFVAVGGSPYYIGGPVGSAVVLTSTNGNDWQASMTNLDNQLSTVTYGKGIWVACGDDGEIFTSSDALNWTNHTLPPTSHNLRNLVYGDGHFIAFAESRDLIYDSTNGVDWRTNETPLASQMANAKFLNGRFMAVGSNGTIMFSDDGLHWLVANTTTNVLLNALAFGKGRYVVGGRPSILGYSMDGTNWTFQSAPMSVDDLQFMDGWFIAVGSNYGMMVSRDGVQWTFIDKRAFNDYSLSTLVYGNGVVVASGGLNLYRSTLQDPAEFKQQLHLLAPAQLEFYGESGQECRLEQSTNLINWTPLSGWVAGTNQYLLWNTGPFQNHANFWRIACRPQ